MPRILIVDDDDDLRRVLAKGLSQFGYDVAVAGNGREAMEKPFELATLLAAIERLLVGGDA